MVPLPKYNAWGNAWIAYGQRLDRMGNAWISTFARLSLFLNAWGTPGDAWGTPGDVWEAPGMCNSRYSPRMGHAWGAHGDAWIVVLCYLAVLVAKFSKYFMSFVRLSKFLNA